MKGLKKIVDAVLVAMMLMASVPGLAENVLDVPSPAALEQQEALPSPQDEG